MTHEENRMTSPVPKMLVVDDDPQSRRLLDRYLRSAGYRVRSAASGPEALGLAAEWLPDVVLLDVMMPGMTGLEVCRRLKSEEETRSIQVMMVTALDETADRVEGLDTGADDYVCKPVQREEFLAKVRALVRARGLLGRLEDARRELERRNRELEMKKSLAQMIVHDLRGPLSAVLGNLDLLSMRLDEERRKVADRARGSLTRLTRMVNDLLDVDCIEEEGYRPDLKETDLAQLAREAVAETSTRPEARDRRILVDLPPDACVVEGDAGMLRRVIDNLLSNAVSHLQEGETVRVAISNRPEGVRIDVIDEGPGVPEEHRETIFEKYAQLELRDAGVRRNRGLGLVFCRLAVELHGGTIWVDGAPEGGAAFHLLLPAAITRETETERPRLELWTAPAGPEPAATEREPSSEAMSAQMGA